MEVTRLRSVEEVEKVRSEWAELQDASGSANPFLGPEWTLRWLELLQPDGDEVWVLTAREDGRLVGVAPLRLHTRLPGIRQLQPIGSSPPWVAPFESPALLATDEHGRRVGRAVLSYLTEHRAAWHLLTICLGETNDWLEPSWVEAEQFTVVAAKAVPYPVLGLPMESRGPGESRRNLREAIRRARNRLTKAYGADGWEVEAVTDPGPIEEAMRDVVRLHRARAAYTDRGERHGDMLADAGVRRWLSAVVADLADRGLVTVYRLRAGDRVLAAQLVLRTRTADFLSVSGFEPDAWEFSPTNFLQSVAVADATERGDVEINFSAWPTEAKLRWTRAVRCSQEFLVVGPSRYAKLVAAPLFLSASALNGYRRELRIDNLRRLVRRAAAPGQAV